MNGLWNALREPRYAVMLVSLLASVLMLAGKLTAYFLTDSYAILSDAAESLVHGAATGLAAFALWYASKPADKRHPYGHGKIAYFSAGFEGALVLAASVTVLYNGVLGLVRGPDLQNLGWGIGISGALAAFNLLLGLALIRIGRRTNTLILVANGRHVLSDMWTTLAAIGGVGLVLITGITWFDPLAALLIGGLIMASGLSLIRESYAGLMDEIDEESSRRLVEKLEQQVEKQRISDFHQLRYRRMNDEIWIDVHLLVPGELSTQVAHARVTRVEESLRALFPDYTVRVTSHIEPADHAAAHPEGHPDVEDPLGSQAGEHV